MFSKFKKVLRYFSVGELALWCSSVLAIVVSFIIFDRKNFLMPIASLIGATSLIFNAKGNPFGQILMIIFSLLYGVISYTFAYWGEMITYLGMTAPMALLATISWFKNPYEKNKKEVKVNALTVKEYFLSFLLSLTVTFIFYFVLKKFNTPNIFWSTVSVTTSFLAVYLTFRRSPFYALAYACNDVVLIILWALATKTDFSYLSVVICFIAFLINDVYGFISWKKAQKKQEKTN